MTTTTEAPPIAADAPGDGPRAPDVPAEMRCALLEIARSAVQVAVGVASGWTLASSVRSAADPELRAAAFVTLTEGGQLRGCMGTLNATQAVVDAVASAAMTVALDDPRFFPIEADELPDLRIEVSVLGTPVPLTDPGAFVRGVDGVIVSRGRCSGLLLPEVATDQGWDGLRMLTAACHKAGLEGTAWRDPATRVSTFRTVRFGGPVLAGGSLARDGNPSA